MQLKKDLKNSFLGGLVLLAPFILTLLMIKFLLDWTSGITDILIQVLNINQYTGQSGLAGQIIVLIGSAFLITVIGLVAKSKIGKSLMGDFGRLVNIVPLYRNVYLSLRHFANSLVENKSKYEKTVIAEYPQKGIYRVGFTTSQTQIEIQEIDERNLLNVFMPNSPNPTGGIMAILPEERVHEVDLSVKEGFKLVMTTGISDEKVNELIPQKEEKN